MAKSNRVFKKTYTNNHAKFQSDRCKVHGVIAQQKLTTYRHTAKQPNRQTDTHTYIFGKRLFLQFFFKSQLFLFFELCLSELFFIDFSLVGTVFFGATVNFEK